MPSRWRRAGGLAGDYNGVFFDGTNWIYYVDGGAGGNWSNGIIVSCLN